MKLVEILAREMVEWPETTTHYTQDPCGTIWPWVGIKAPVFNGSWTCEDDALIDQSSRAKTYDTEPASDHSTAIVTREMWQAERDRLAAPKLQKANKDGWIRHRGGKCPVEAGTLVDVRHRDGDVYEKCEAGFSGYCSSWTHDGVGGDIMAWRPHVATNEMPKININASSLTEGLKSPSQVAQEIGRVMRNPAMILDYNPSVEDGPLQWRDRIHTIDAEQRQADQAHKASTEARAHERAELVSKLAGEGLALLEKEEAPNEDMSDWRNWKAGDYIQSISDRDQDIEIGGVYQLYANTSEYSVYLLDAVGDKRNRSPEDYKWHSRP